MNNSSLLTPPVGHSVLAGERRNGRWRGRHGGETGVIRETVPVIYFPLGSSLFTFGSFVLGEFASVWLLLSILLVGGNGVSSNLRLSGLITAVLAVPLT
jgi:hypothetical protein